MITVAQIIAELIYPLLGVLGVILRAAGALGVGVVAGSVLRDAVQYKVQARFYVPLIFLGTVGLFAALSFGPWSSPGTIAMAGIGVFVGYRTLRSRQSAGQATATTTEGTD
jgi:hypothetical protein